MDIYSLADRGGNSAWKGFSSQTTFIVNRLISEKDDALNYYPESIEDLRIVVTDGSEVELIQVKNLSSDLHYQISSRKKRVSCNIFIISKFYFDSSIQ